MRIEVLGVLAVLALAAGCGRKEAPPVAAPPAVPDAGLRTTADPGKPQPALRINLSGPRAIAAGQPFTLTVGVSFDGAPGDVRVGITLPEGAVLNAGQAVRHLSVGEDSPGSVAYVLSVQNQEPQTFVVSVSRGAFSAATRFSVNRPAADKPQRAIVQPPATRRTKDGRKVMD